MSLLALLRALSAPRSVAGAELARRLGIGAAALKSQIAQARRLGIAIDARAGHGYRLARPLDLLDAGALQEGLPPSVRPLLAALEVADCLDSSNSELLRRAAAGAASGSVLLAEAQSAGRGRRGRSWQSPFAAHIALSVLWRYPRGPGALAGLSLAVGVAVQRALLQLGVAGTALKWPNDVVAAGRKLAGILVEAGGDGAGSCHVVVGVGLNVALPESQAVAIDQPWVDLATLAGGAAPARTRVATALVAALLPALQDFGAAGLAPFLPEWRRHDALAGREVCVLEAAQRHAATALGVDAQGRLRVRDADGRERALASAEVSLRLA